MLNEEKSASGGDNQDPPQPNDSSQASGTSETPPVLQSHNTPASQGDALQGYRRKFPIPKVAILGIVFLFLFALVAGAYILGKNSVSNETVIVPSPSPDPTPAPTTKNLITYTDFDAHWTMDYWDEMEISTRSATELGPDSVGLDMVNFLKVGPTQAEGTEFFDGLSITVGVVRKDASETLRTFADRKTQAQDPDIEHNRVYFREININGHPGYEAYIEGYGDYTIIYLEYPTMRDRAYQITIMSVGPDKEMYDEIWREMIETFKSR